MDTTNYDLKDLLKNVRKYIDKYKYNIYFITEEHLLISKEKMEIASSICKVDLISDLVAEFT